MKAEEYKSRQDEHLGWRINVVSYRLGERFHCTVDDFDPGARLARGEGATREEAEEQALEKARRYLAQTRRVG
jgi:hypothetical protein